MTQYAVGPQVTQVWTGDGPVLLANQDLVNTVTVGDQPNVAIGAQNADAIPPLGSIAYQGGRRLYAIAPAGTLALLAVTGGTSWAPSPTQIALQIQALGVPPAVPGLGSGSQTLQGPGTGPYTMYTFASAGRIWAANISYSMGSSGGTGSNQGYARVRVAGGATLAIVECCVVGAPAQDSNTDSQTFPGLSVPAGTVVQLDVNSATTITGVVQRGSGLVVVSIP